MQDTDIYKEIRHRLMSAMFDHGQRIKAEHLRHEFGCSASTIREALFRLSTVGLVEFREQRGFRVPEKSNKLVHDLTHLRVLLEQEGTCMSIRNGGVAWEARLTAAHHQLSHIEKRIHESEDPSPLTDIWFRAENEFHQTLIAACNSPVLQQTHAEIYARFRQQLMFEDRNFDFISNNIQHHYDIMTAALSGDEPLTRRRIYEHLSRHMNGQTPLSDVPAG